MSAPQPRFYFGFGSTWTTSDARISWTEVTGYVMSKQGARGSRGRSTELDDMRMGTFNFTLNNSTRRFDPTHTASPYWETALDLTGASGSSASTPDAAAMDIVGDLDLRIRAAIDDVTPAADSLLLSKFATSGNQRSYRLMLRTSGVLRFTHSADGSANSNVDSTVTLASVGIDDAEAVWLRATIDVDNGAAGRTVKFWYSLDDTNDHTLVTWTQLGASVTTAGVTSIFSGTANVYIGASSPGTADNLAGVVYAAAILNGIAGTVVANPNFTIGLGAGATSLTDATGKVWTINSPATIAAGDASYLQPGVPVKITGTANGTEYPVFRGFAGGWPQDYDQSNRLAYVGMRCTDGFGKLATAGTPASVSAYEVQQADPTAVWSMDERTGLTMADRSGNGHDGRYLNGVLGQDPLLEDGGQSASFAHVGDNRGLVTNQALVTAYPFTLEAWVKFPRDLAAIHSFIVGTKDAALGAWVWFACFHNGGIPLNSAGAVGLWISGGRGVRGTTAIDDDERHHVVAIAHSQTSFDLYVDGVQETEVTFESGTGLSASYISGNIKQWSVGNVADNTAGDYGMGGNIDNPAIYPVALTSGQIADLYAAGSAPWDGDTTGERIARLLDLVGWPSDLRTLATGETILGWATLGANALALLRKMEAAEQGRLFISRDGKVTFLTRYYHLEVAEGMTPQATFVDNGSGAYSGLAFDYDDALVLNRVRGSRVGGTDIEAVDQDSIERYGEQVDTSLAGIQVVDDGQVRDACEHRLLRYSTPQLRARPLEINMLRLTAAQQAQVLSLELGYRVQLQRTPQGIGSPIAQETIVEGVNHQLGAATWSVTLMLSPADTRTYFTLDTSLLDGSDVLAY